MSEIIQLHSKKEKSPKEILRKRTVIVLGFIFLFVVGWGIAWAINYSAMENQSIKIATMEKEQFSVVLSCEFLIVRDEIVVPSPHTGQVNYRVDIVEGERIRHKHTIATISTPNIDGILVEHAIAAPRAGIVSYIMDGYEDLFAGVTLTERPTVQTLLELTAAEEENYRTREYSVYGAPIARIINPFTPVRLLLIITKEEIAEHHFDPSELSATNKTIIYDENEYSIAIIQGEEAADHFLYEAEIEQQKENFYYGRKHPAQLIAKRYEGYYVNMDALVVKNEQSGIYVVEEEQPRWIPVDIVAWLEEACFVLVEEEYDQFVINPQILEL